jgi:hypothetical protein
LLALTYQNILDLNVACRAKRTQMHWHIHKFKCPLKKMQPSCPCSRDLNWTGKGLSTNTLNEWCICWSFTSLKKVHGPKCKKEKNNKMKYFRAVILYTIKIVKIIIFVVISSYIVYNVIWNSFPGSEKYFSIIWRQCKFFCYIKFWCMWSVVQSRCQ